MGFKIGQKVVCVNDTETWINLGELKKDEIYTIVDFNENDGGLVLKECCSLAYKGAYNKDRFKPLKYDIISNKNIISQIVEEKCDIPLKVPVRRLLFF